MIYVFAGAGIVLAGALIWLGLILRSYQGRFNAIQESEKHFHSLFMDFPDAVFVLEGGNILHANLQGLRLLSAKSPEDVQGKEFASFFQLTSSEPESGKAEPPVFGKRMESLVETVWERVDGARLPVQFRIRTIPWKGRPAVVLVARDVTRIKARQEEREKMSAQLAQSQKMEAIGHLAGGVAHEFNNLLTSILGNAEIITHEAVTEDVRAKAQNMMTSARRAADLTNKLLAFARKGKYKIAPIDLHTVIEEIATLAAHTFPRSIQVIKDLLPEPVPVLGDPKQLRQILIDLAVNAREAMPNGGALIFSTTLANLGEAEARKHDLPQPGKYLLVSVSDSGSGIDPAVLPHIFEPFFTTKPKRGGSGLGLAMVYGILKNHDGSIEVETKQDAGTTFRVYLPLASPQDKPPDPDQEQAEE